MAQLNPRELDVLNILWKKRDEALTSTDIVNEQRGLTQSTVITVLRKLLNDNLVEVAGVTHSGKVLSRTYRPTKKSQNIILDNFISVYVNFIDIIPKSDLCTAILSVEQSPDQMRSEVSKLKEILDGHKKKN